MGRYHYCPACGSPTRAISQEARERDHCDRCSRVWYENAKPCAGAVVMSEGHILLAKRAIQPFLGYWDLPGGFLEADEHPADGACREVLEETGLMVEIGPLLGIYMDTYRPGTDQTSWHHSLNVFYLARPIGGHLCASSESRDVRWFRVDELPPMNEIAYENGRRALSDFLNLEQEKFNGWL